MKFYRGYAGLITIMIVMIFSACRPALRDVSSQGPYREAIGKKFILQRDLYVYKFHDSPLLQLGSANNMPPDSMGVPEEVDEKYIGLNAEYLTLKGVVKKGQVFTIKKALYKEDYYFPYVSYRVVLDGNQQFSNKEINTMQMIELTANPPKTETWSTPPIFKSDMALPLASEGEWWKQSNRQP